MIKKLRKKFIIITMLVLFAVFFTVVATINIVNYVNINKSANNILNIIEENNGQMPGPIKPEENKDEFGKMHGEAPFSTRFFTVTFTKDQISSVNLERIAMVSDEEAKDIATKLYKDNNDEGFYRNFKYRLVQIDDNQMYIFLDCARELDNFSSFLWASIWISLGGLLVIFILVFLFSGIATRPIAESYSKQKEFITNINHEIKTPLSIVKATNEVIEMEQGKTEWTDIINSQITRLTELTDKLVFLSRMDEENVNFTKASFNFSQMALEVSEPFVVLATSKGKTLDVEIEDNMVYFGEVSLIGELISILIENAIKYSSDNSNIKLKVYSQGKNKKIVVSNLVEYITPGKLDYLFERFYRSSNINVKGHGIGLSMAKAIVSLHKGKIQAYSHDGTEVFFVVTL